MALKHMYTVASQLSYYRSIQLIEGLDCPTSIGSAKLVSPAQQPHACVHSMHITLFTTQTRNRQGYSARGITGETSDRPLDDSTWAQLPESICTYLPFTCRIIPLAERSPIAPQARGSISLLNPISLRKQSLSSSSELSDASRASYHRCLCYCWSPALPSYLVGHFA